MISFAKGALRHWYDQYSTIGKVYLTLALIAIVVDACISYEYGANMTTLHGIGFALVAIFFAVLPDASFSEFEKGNKSAGAAFALGAILLGPVAYYSHLGYQAGLRGENIQQTNWHNAKAEGKADNTKELQEKIAFHEKRRDELDKELDALVSTKVGGWSVSVRPSSPEELDGVIAAKTLEREQEAAKGGCKGKCLLREQELAHLKALRGKAEAIAKNNDMHQAALNGLAAARNALDETAYESSPIVNQTAMAAKVANLARGNYDGVTKVDAVSLEIANIAINGGGSLAFMVIGALGLMLAGRNKLAGVSFSEPIAQSLDVARTAANDTPKLSIRDAMERGFLALPRAA